MGNIKYFFKSMYSNETVIKEHKKPWYLAFIMLFVALALCWIPPFWRYNTTNGSGTYQNVSGLDTALYSLVVDESNGFGESYIDQNGNIVVTEQFKTNAKYDNKTNPEGIKIYTKQQGSNDQKDIKIMSVFYFDIDLSTTEGAKTYQDFADAVFKDENGKTKNPFSFILFTKTTFAITLYQVKDITDKSQPIAQYAGYYKEFPKGKENTFKKMILGDSDKYTPAIAKENWNNLLHLGVMPQLFSEMVLYLSLFLGGIVVCAILNGLIIFVMSRTKRSNYKEMTYFEATKAGTTLTFTPSIVGFILAFLMGNSMAFMIFLGINLLRLVFSCNKINRHKEEVAPLYQSRS